LTKRGLKDTARQVCRSDPELLLCSVHEEEEEEEEGEGEMCVLKME
jgi:hypothetical protein